MNIPAVRPEQQVTAGQIMESVIIKGDLAQLKPDERAKYYTRVCESMGLNPLTKPFEYITLNGKLTLYARKDATDQLRRIYGVSVVEMTDTMHEGVTIVTAKMRDATGRTDMAKGAVSLKGLQGEALANAIMKAETKAKRRATLSICGLGFFDETEIDEEMPTDVKRYTKTKQQAKELFSALQAEVHLLSSAIQARGWLEHNAERMKLLPRDWEDFLRTSCEDLIRSDEPTEVWSDDDIPDSKWDALGPVKQAGVLCNDESFWKFFTEKEFPCTSAETAAKIVRSLCNIKSRTELATNTTASVVWRRLVADYRAWQREPEIVNQVSAQIVERRAPETSAAPVPSSPQPQAGAADDVPTAAEYILRWLTEIGDADDPAQSVQMAQSWNEEKSIREKIEWPTGSFVDLQRKVKRAIEALKPTAETDARIPK